MLLLQLQITKEEGDRWWFLHLPITSSSRDCLIREWGDNNNIEVPDQSSHAVSKVKVLLVLQEM